MSDDNHVNATLGSENARKVGAGEATFNAAMPEVSTGRSPKGYTLRIEHGADGKAALVLPKDLLRQLRDVWENETFRTRTTAAGVDALVSLGYTRVDSDLEFLTTDDIPCETP